jgi:hypothetical protein
MREPDIVSDIDTYIGNAMANSDIEDLNYNIGAPPISGSI